jgi:hypothetical protein
MVVTALLIGLAGSLHCAGMCSPLAAAVVGPSRSAWIGRLLYNAGRIITYGLLGAGVGAFGALAGLTSYQASLSAILGTVLVLLGVSGAKMTRIPFLTRGMQRVTIWLKSLFGTLVKSRSGWSLLLLGGVNGLLPCGLTYFALTYCITLPGAWQGFAFMGLFGLGTLPTMVGMPAVLNFVSGRLLPGIRNVTALVMILLGSLLVLRSAWIHPHEPTAVVQAGEAVCP